MATEQRPPRDEKLETLSEMGAAARSGRDGLPHGDDSLMERYTRWDLDRFSARQAVAASTVTALILLVFAGGSVRGAADEVDPGFGQDVLKAIAEPTGWVSDRLPFSEARTDATSWLSPDDELGAGGFGESEAEVTAAGEAPPPGAELERVLVTGDSLSTPLDVEVAQEIADDGSSVEVIRDPHLATGISNEIVDWGALSSGQSGNEDPDAVVMFIGANEGYPMTDAAGTTLQCCDAAWEAELAARVGRMMDNYVAEGDTRLYWLTVPVQRDPARLQISEAVNRSIAAEAAKRREAVEVIDTVPIFTPDGYSDTIDIDGDETIVRESDGIHLNGEGSSLAAEIVLEAIDADFER
jgi:lysophospholipase L1-like esterase